MTGKEESVYLSDMPPLEGNEEVKEEKALKILIRNKLLTRFPNNNSNKLKIEIRQILYFLYQHNQITKKFYNNLIKSL